MGDGVPQESLRARLAGHWQVPLLLVSGTFLVLGVWRLRPIPEPPPFDSLFARAASLRDAGLYPEASDYIEQLLGAPERKPEEAGRLHRLMADVIYRHESSNAVHGESNVRRIVEHGDKAAAAGVEHDARMHWIRAHAFEWMRRPQEAVEEYRAAIAVGIERPWYVRQRALEIQKSTSTLAPDQLHAAYDEFVAADSVPDELRYWGAEQKVELYIQQDKHEEAERYLARHAARFTEEDWKRAYDYLQAYVWYDLGRLDDADRMLRSVRDQLPPGHSLYSRSGWLLGRVLQAQEAPEIALGLFDEVINNTTPGPYRTMSVFGRAQALAAVERFSDSVAAYQEGIRLTAENPYGSIADLRVVREETTAIYQAQLAAGHLKEAMSFLRIAVRLVPPADIKAQAAYRERLADLAFAIGKAAMARAEGGAAESGEAYAEAREFLQEAGNEYLELAKVAEVTSQLSESAMWRAADAFDLAGSRRRTTEVLTSFISERPVNMRTPMAILRLAQTYQAMGETDQAIRWYQKNLIEFPRTPAAIASLVPLADCFIAKGETSKAEEILLRVVVRTPDDPLTLITPAAVEYREALFRLGDLYIRAGDFEKAIARYEEAVERYQDDPRRDRATFILADAYRQSAAQVRTALDDNRNMPFKDDLRRKHRRRLERARELYDRLIEQYRASSQQALDEMDQLYLKLSHFYRADAVYDLSQTSAAGDLQPFAQALELYDRAAWLYQSDPMAMSAYVQMVNCHLQMGSVDKARMAVQRARWTLKGIADDTFRQHAPSEDRAFWENYLTWLERTPAMALASAGAPG